MTNFERIKAFTLPDMMAFLEQVSVTGGDNLTNEACRHCRESYDNCPYGETDEPEACRLLGRSATIEY